MPVSNISPLRNAARMLQLEAYVRGHRGDAHGAIESIRANWRLGESQEYEPLLVSQLIRLAVDGVALLQFEEFLSSVDISANDLRMLQAEFRKFDGESAIARSLRGESALGFQSFEESIGDPQAGPVPLVRLFLNSDKAYYLEQMQRMIEAAEQPMPASRLNLRQVEDDLELVLSGSYIQKIGKSVSAIFLSPGVSSATANGFYRVAGRARAADAAIAAELFRRQHDRFPTSLSELVPDFLPAVPLDPYTGLPLKTMIRNQELAIYSVGEDTVDDGGVEDNRMGRPDNVFTLKLRPAEASTE